MKVVFRVDASTAIGIGHFVRCVTLATELRMRGAEVVFVCRNDPGVLAQKLANTGGTLELLASVDNAIDDAEATAALLDTQRPDWLVVDHYALDARWERRVRRPGLRILAVDDYWDRDHDCDIYLNQNYIRDDDVRLRVRRGQGYPVLAGPRFALLHEEYRQARGFSGGRRRHPVARVLVTFGGSDQDDVTGLVLRALDNPRFAGLELEVVVGNHNPNAARLEEAVAKRPRARMYHNLPHLVDHMSRTDLAICAGGSTIWELMCLGVPSAVVCTGDNQRSASEALARDGYIQYMGQRTDIDETGVRAALASFVTDNRWIEEVSGRCMSLVDGSGAKRIADSMLEMQNI